MRPVNLAVPVAALKAGPTHLNLMNHRSLAASCHVAFACARGEQERIVNRFV
jgi:hypothetical protein